MPLRLGQWRWPGLFSLLNVEGGILPFRSDFMLLAVLHPVVISILEHHNAYCMSCSPHSIRALPLSHDSALIFAISRHFYYQLSCLN